VEPFAPREAARWRRSPTQGLGQREEPGYAELVQVKWTEDELDPADPAKSLVVGTDKDAAGALYVAGEFTNAGAVAVSAMAILADFLFGRLERTLVSRGLRRD